MYENMKICNHENMKTNIYMSKNKYVKNVKECVKRVNIYLKSYKVRSNRNVNKETNKYNKKEKI